MTAGSGFEVLGLDHLAHLSRAMREAGGQGKGLKAELRKELNRATKQTRKEMRAAIMPSLPRRGGLGADVLRSTRFSTVLGTGSDVRVSIRATSARSIRRMNETGAFRHPVFGRSGNPWVLQVAGRPDKGFLDKPFEQSRPGLQRAVYQAIARIGEDIYRRT